MRPGPQCQILCNENHEELHVLRTGRIQPLKHTRHFNICGFDVFSVGLCWPTRRRNKLMQLVQTEGNIVLFLFRSHLSLIDAKGLDVGPG